jgi:hypothetical protein
LRMHHVVMTRDPLNRGLRLYASRERSYSTVSHVMPKKDGLYVTLLVPYFCLHSPINWLMNRDCTLQHICNMYLLSISCMFCYNHCIVKERHSYLLFYASFTVVAAAQSVIGAVAERINFQSKNSETDQRI